MSYREALTAANSKVKQGESKAQPYAVSELILQELWAIEVIGHGGEPCPSLLGTEHLVLSQLAGSCQEHDETSSLASCQSFLARRRSSPTCLMCMLAFNTDPSCKECRPWTLQNSPWPSELGQEGQGPAACSSAGRKAVQMASSNGVNI
jgi:hypothetical protein